MNRCTFQFELGILRTNTICNYVLQITIKNKN